MNINDITIPNEEPRFAYEEAEAHLDKYSERQDDQFQRAYMKTKFMAVAYAYGDYYAEGIHPENALARGWEELQIAFTGQGEAFLSGAVLHLWNSLPNAKSEKSFARAVKKAFNLAEKATPAEAVRLYMKKYRLADLRNPDDGFTLQPVLPTSGVRLREWAEVEGLDADEVEQQFAWLEHADRREEEDDEEMRALPGRPSLRIVDGGLDSQGRKKGKKKK